MSKVRWTDEAIRAEALKYQSGGEWKKGSKGSYTAAHRRKGDFFELCCEHMTHTRRVKKWTDELLRAEALKYSIRNEFKDGSESAYMAARRKGKEFLDLCCQHMAPAYESWTDESLRTEALKYSTRNDFKHGSTSAYKAAWYKGEDFVDLCCQHMVAQQINWTDEEIRAEALQYPTRNDFKHGSTSAYKAAWYRGEEFVESCCQHMVCMSNSDNDAIYIWKAEREFYNGEPVYKIGRTSARLGTRRIKMVAQESGFTATVIALVNVNGRATSVEKTLLALGQDPKYLDFGGATEFRAMSDAELQKALEIIEASAVEDALQAA